MRRSDPQADPIEDSLARSIYFRTQIRELSGEPPYLPRTSEEIYHLSSHEIENQLWQLLNETAKVTAATHILLSALVNGQLTDRECVQDLLRKGLNTRSDLMAWIDSTPEGWKFVVVPNINLNNVDQRGSVFPVVPKLISFKDQNHAGIWMGWWLARIQLAQRLLEIIRCLPQSRADYPLQATKELLQADICSIVNLICASTPFLLGDVDQQGYPSQLNKYHLACPGLAAYYLAHGMSISNQMPGLNPDVRRFILDTLFRVGHSKGINHALSSRNDWLEDHPEYDHSQLRTG
ncbi:hypothetical protein EJ05DRAFT_11813 [Pseudovirgaria hyperparasitica]|uniref:Uncharacterized protein n=1 Tax=Pseudovirgaria hyperparasitica TaxID=470096 RepID=A0A6A6WKP7_9PEZI|nr:uncharacterized protein EJ05DRAFT_11813 [Pseudovirgaria hyperparasitica]KAF2762747.1 hypothetical protein EJ05DRAFT_11813 [Pseudovirgaria hyperparasitica]